MATSVWLWVGFIAFVLVMLALDLGVFHRKAHAVKPITTRRYFSGRHQVDLLVNGRVAAQADFDLRV